MVFKMDAKGMGSALTSTMKVLAKIALIVGSLFASIMVLWLIIGAINNSAQSGNLPVTTPTLTALNTTETAFGTSISAVTDNVTTVIGFVALVVILGVIGWVVFGRKGKSGSADY